MFYKCESLLFLPDLNNWKIKYNAKNDGIIDKCTSLINAPGIYNLSPYYLRVGKMNLKEGIVDLNLDDIKKNELINLICRLR